MIENKTVKILLVEDDIAVADLIKAMLAKSRDTIFTVRHVATLKESIERLAQDKGDTVILDLSLPDSSGLDTLLKLRAQASAVPIVVLTGLDDTSMAVKAVQLGAQDYLAKSRVDASLLIRAIHYAIERNRIENELKDTRDKLEVCVQERTEELVKINVFLRQEVTQRKQKEQQLRQAYAKLQQAQDQLIQAEKMQVVGALASGVAHEVKNPLAIILQAAEFLEKKINNSDENVLSVLKDIERAVVRADNIIRGLLDFSRLSRLEITPQDLNSLITDCLILLKHQFDKYHIEVTKDFSSGIPPVEIDKNRIEQVLINLLMNAVQSTPGVGKLTVRSYLQAADGSLSRGSLPEGDNGNKHAFAVVEIEDNGSGIAPDLLSRIFDPFVTTKRGIGGTGLGLSIVRNIIEMHKGRIEVNNKEEGGVRVRVMFKLQKKDGGV